jgi:hypothetical protein
MVRSWKAGAANYGLRISSSNEANNNTWRRYYSANMNVTPPHINITFTPDAPATPTDVAATPGADDYTTSAAPTITSTVETPGGVTVRENVTVHSAEGDVVYTGSSPYVGSGTTASLTLPAGTLEPGADYLVSIAADNGSLTSAEPAEFPLSFQTDATAVAAAKDDAEADAETVDPSEVDYSSLEQAPAVADSGP